MVTAQLTPIGVDIHNVLIATDLSRCSKAALEFGLEVSKGYKAETYIVFVVPINDFLLAGPEAFVAARDAGRRDLQELKADLKRAYNYDEGKDYHLFLLEGDVAQSILDFSRQNQIDLIVVGTHGRAGLGKALLGSVAERVFRHSPVPVLTMGPCLRRSALGNSPTNILAAVDFTPASERSIRYAASLACEHKAKLTALHVVKRELSNDAAERDRMLQDIKAHLGEVVQRETAGAPCSLRVEVGPVVPTILHTSDEIKSDLLVLGVRSSLGVLDRLMWPHAYEIVRESCCPVLTVRENIEH